MIDLPAGIIVCLSGATTAIVAVLANQGEKALRESITIANVVLNYGIVLSILDLILKR